MIDLVKTRNALLKQAHMVGEHLNTVTCADGLKNALINQINAIEQLISVTGIDDYKKTKIELAHIAEKVGGVGLYCCVLETKCKISV